MGRNRKLRLTSGPTEKGQIDFKPLSGDLSPLNGVILQGPDSVGETPLTITLPAFLVEDGVYTSDSSNNQVVKKIEDINVATGAAIALAKLAALTSDRALTSNGSGVISASSVTTTELGYLSGVTSAIQTQLDAKAPSATAVTLSDIQTLSNKTLQTPILNQPGVSDYIEMTEQVSAPGTPTSNHIRVYAKQDHGLYKIDPNGIESPVGSGGGSGGINFLILDSSWAPIKSNNSDFNASVGDWAAYADAAGVAPVDMTGGSPSITVSRTTTNGEVLDGAGSLKVVKGAANEQGEGVSCVAYVPLAYRGQIASIQFPFKVVSGSLVDGDLRFYVYDVTNSQVITPVNNYCTATGTMRMTFPTASNTAQIRVGLHFASTSATAVTFTIDDIVVGPQQVSFGPSMTDWREESGFTVPSGFGTVTDIKIWTRQVGDSLQGRGYFVPSSLDSAVPILQLPSKYVIDSTKFSNITNAQPVGLSLATTTSTSTDSWTGGFDEILFYDGSTTNQLFFAANSLTNEFEKRNADASYVALPAVVNVEFTIPIQGFSTNVVQQNAGMFSLSSYLVNGTRVTGSAPTQLGQYRSYIRQAGGGVYVETNGEPSELPTMENGVRLYTANDIASGDASNQPSKYEFFVGKGKKLSFDFFYTTGRSGPLDTTTYVDSNDGYSAGVIKLYDPTTGILTIAQNIINGSGDLITGFDAAYSSYSLAYFDVYVSEQVVPVQVTPLRSQVWLTGGNGHGSTNTTVRRYANIQTNTGSALTIVQDASLGDSIVVNEDGNYDVSFLDSRTDASESFGITIDSSQLSTNVASINPPVSLGRIVNAAGGIPIGYSRGSLPLLRGQVIRLQTSGAADETIDTDVMLMVTKAGN